MMKWDSDEFRAERDRKMLAWMCGNEDAVRVVVQTSHIAEVWDDLADKDRTPTDREIAHAFESAMIHLQTNRFYLANHAMLMGVIVLVANAWHDANQWEVCGDWRAHQAFYLRNMGIELAILCAFICGGYDHMRRVSTEIREFFHHETFEEWRHAA
jgi:hypothetical protein